MAAIGVPPRSADEIRDENLELARLAGLVESNLEAAAGRHPLGSPEYCYFVGSAANYRLEKKAHERHAAMMQLAIDCINAGFPPERLSIMEIELAAKRWEASKAKVA